MRIDKRLRYFYLLKEKFLLLQEKPADKMCWYVSEIHEEKIQVRVARQATDIQQKSIIHHADNHPVETNTNQTISQYFIQKTQLIIGRSLHFALIKTIFAKTPTQSGCKIRTT